MSAGIDGRVESVSENRWVAWYLLKDCWRIDEEEVLIVDFTKQNVC